MSGRKQQTLSGFDDPTDGPAQTPAELIAPPAPSVRDTSSAEGSPNSLEGKTVYVVDSFSLIFQVFHAMQGMTNPSGEPVNATYGFARDLVFLLEEKQPDYLFCAFDLPGKTFRHTIYPEYKIHRKEMPEDLRPQIEQIRRLLEAIRIPIVQWEDHEADDVLATMAREIDQQGGNCLLVTSDKDCRQLLSDRVKMYNIRKNTLFDRADLAETWGIRPDQVVDFQSLVGDSVDNVPGVALIGPKIARELLTQYETLEGVLDKADEIPGKKRSQNIREGRDVALLSRQLVRLVDDLPLNLDWSTGVPGQGNAEQVAELCHEFGFQSLGEKLIRLSSGESPPPETPWEADYRAITTPEAWKSFLADLKKQKRISVDTETTHINPRWAELVGLSFCWSEGEAVYLPLRAPEGEPILDEAMVLEGLRPVLEDPSIEKIGQNLKYDMVVLRGYDIELRGLSFDTMVASYLLDAGQRGHSLDRLASRYLHHETIKIKELIGSGRDQKRMDEVPLELIAPYAAEDADIPWRLHDMLRQRLDTDRLSELCDTLELPLIEVLAELEFTGLRVEPDRLSELSQRYGERMTTLESEIYEIAGHEFNLASPKQLGVVLFDELKLPVIKKTKTGRSTDAEVLETLAQDHDLPARIIEYRQYAKLKSTYVDALPKLIHPTTGRVHTSLNQVVAATGRLSSNDPNLQNIPVRTAEGREIRSAFRAGPDGWHLLAADYSQIELRVLAHFSGDETLCQAFADDEDIHALVASQVYDVPLEKVDRDMRRSAKAINFGIIYGQSSFGLAKALDISQDEAATFIDAYFARYPGVDQFMTHILEECLARGYVTTLLGRRRAISGVRDPSTVTNPRQRLLPERTAINTVIQGSAADLIKLAMLAVHHRLRRENHPANMLLQIHDELMFETPPEEIDGLASLVMEEMSHAKELIVPLKVDVKTGLNWADCEPWE